MVRLPFQLDTVQVGERGKVGHCVLRKLEGLLGRRPALIVLSDLAQHRRDYLIHH